MSSDASTCLSRHFVLLNLCLFNTLLAHPPAITRDPTPRSTIHLSAVTSSRLLPRPSSVHPFVSPSPHSFDLLPSPLCLSLYLGLMVPAKTPNSPNSTTNSVPSNTTTSAGLPAPRSRGCRLGLLLIRYATPHALPILIQRQRQRPHADVHFHLSPGHRIQGIALTHDTLSTNLLTLHKELDSWVKNLPQGDVVAVVDEGSVGGGAGHGVGGGDGFAKGAAMGGASGGAVGGLYDRQ